MNWKTQTMKISCFLWGVSTYFCQSVSFLSFVKMLKWGSHACKCILFSYFQLHRSYRPLLRWCWWGAGRLWAWGGEKGGGFSTICSPPAQWGREGVYSFRTLLSFYLPHSTNTDHWGVPAQSRCSTQHPPYILFPNKPEHWLQTPMSCLAAHAQ